MKKNLFKDTFCRNLIFLTIITYVIELLFRALSKFEIISYESLRILISTFLLAMIVTFLSSFCKKKWLRNVINLVYIFIYALYAILQIGFINYLGVYMSFNTSSQFGAVTDYIGDYLSSFKLSYFAVVAPLLVALFFYLFLYRGKKYHKMELKGSHLMLIPVFIVLCGLYYGSLKAPFMQNKLQIKSNIKLFANPDVPTVAVNEFGTTMFGLLDLKSFLFPTSVEEDEEYSFEPNSSNNSSNIVTTREVSPLLGNLVKEDSDKKYSTLNSYFNSQPVTDYNEYTGVFEGKNVVVILVESGNEAFINEEYFPNFYKLYSEGWHWINNYSPRNSCATGNNEFSAMTGLYSIYNSCTANVYKNNTYYESIFGVFNDKGYRTTSFHDFNEWYYKRSVIHPNMGSGKFYGANDLKIKTASYYGEWPSDEEFFEKVFDILLNDESDKPFMTFLTTVTSHQPYSNSSTYGDLYKDYFKKEGYSTVVSRYLSKLKVVDNAFGIMIDKLTEAGKLDDTVIVIMADHYPYGLNKTYVKEMIDHDLSDYDIEKTPFVIYNSTMAPQEFTEYTSYINLVPTMANLAGLDYDPRLYMGADLLSDSYESRVVFADGSWKNEIAYYNASTSKIKYYGDTELTPEEIKEVNTKVGLQIDMSSKAIKSNYFKYLKGKLDEYNASLKVEEEVETSVEETNIDSN